MPSSDRSRGFSVVLNPVPDRAGRAATPNGDAARAAQGARPQNIAVNTFVPVEVENSFFKGSVLIIHETGNEPDEPGDLDENKDADPKTLRGVVFQLQGQFKKAVSSLWVCGEMRDPLKLGWVTHGMASVIIKFIKRMTNGQAHCCLGTPTERPHLGFPAGLVFTCIATPPGEKPPELGSQELMDTKYQGGDGRLEVVVGQTYTFMYRTPWVDLCSWELLKVPGVSPLPFETMIGDVTELTMMFYDLEAAQSHANCREGALFELTLSRCAEGESWPEDKQGGASTPLELISNISEDDSQESEAQDEAEDLAGLEGENKESDSDDDEDVDDLALEDSVAVGDFRPTSRPREGPQVCSAWEPRAETVLSLDAGAPLEVPWYIEAIDRRRRRRLRVWYVFQMSAGEAEGEWYKAKAITELATLIRPRPQLRVFRRGNARGCLSATTLEQFRHNVILQVAPDYADSRVRGALMGDVAKEVSPLQEVTSHSKTSYVSASLPPPRFFVSGKACDLAFENARADRSSSVREGLVGAIHYEGRICEELLRVSSNGTMHWFTPYDCDKPRMVLTRDQVWKVERVEGLFLGRFHLWEIHTEHRVFVFCCAEEQERDDWLQLIGVEASIDDAGHMKDNITASDAQQVANILMDTSRSRRWRPKARIVLNDRRMLLKEPCEMPATGAEELLGQALAFTAQPSLEAKATFAEFVDATCLLKTVKFRGWSQSLCLTFWLNVYHCLLIHGRLLLGMPRTRREALRFHSRVSYLVGTVPLSLKEIEQYILRSPSVDPDQLRAEGRDRAQRFIGQHVQQLLQRLGRPCRCLFSRQSSNKLDDCCPQPCLPNININMPVTFVQHRRSDCLYLGQPPEELKEPIPDIRTVFCLNRCNLSCLSAVPVFSAERLSDQMDEVTRLFLLEFVHVQDFAGMLTLEVTLPHCCRSVKRTLKLDSQALLRFLWQFMPPENSLNPMARPQVRFQKYRREPRSRRELMRLQYSTTELEPSSARARVGSDSDSVGGMVQMAALYAGLPLGQKLTERGDSAAAPGSPGPSPRRRRKKSRAPPASPDGSPVAKTSGDLEIQLISNKELRLQQLPLKLSL